MTDNEAVRIARRIFTIAAIYGVVTLLPIYFAEPMMARVGRPITHPEFLYGFVGAALVFQLIYWMIGRDPLRYRPLMPLGTLAKCSFGVPVWVLFALGRVDAVVLAFSSIDLLIAILFLIARRITRPA